MPIKVRCLCGHELLLKSELAGKKIRCPECAEIIRIPARKKTHPPRKTASSQKRMPQQKDAWNSDPYQSHQSDPGFASHSRSTRLIECCNCRYTGHLLEAHRGYKWWALPLGFALACTGIGLIPMAVIMIVMGNRTYEACPNCKSDSLSEWYGLPSRECNQIWLRQ